MKKNGNLFLILIVTLAVLAPVLGGEFLSWDDERNLFGNEFLKSGDLRAFWKEAYFGLYIPLIYTVWGWLWSIAGADPVVFHAFNLILHLFNTGLVFLLIRGLLDERSSWAAVPAAFLFALHPLQLETVAWVSGGRDLLSVSFALGAVGALQSRHRAVSWGLSPVLYLAGLLCKPAIVALPFCLWIFYFLKIPGRGREILLKMFSWILVSGPVLWVTFQVQQESGVVPAEIWLRPWVMLDTYGFYLKSFLFPFDLAPDYGRTPQWLKAHWEGSWLLAASALTFFSLALWRRLRSVWLMPALLFFVWLLPVSGILTFSFQNISTVADRYMYVPVAILAAGLALQFKSLNSQPPVWFRRSFIAGLVLGLGGLTLSYLPNWKNDPAFFEAMIRSNPRSFSGHSHLGRYYDRNGEFEKAAPHFLEAFRLAPTIFTNISSAVVTLQRLERHSEVAAMDTEFDQPYYEPARRMQKQEWAALVSSLAVSLEAQGRDGRAVQRMCEALRAAAQDSHVARNAKILQQRLVLKRKELNCAP